MDGSCVRTLESSVARVIFQQRNALPCVLELRCELVDCVALNDGCELICAIAADCPMHRFRSIDGDGCELDCAIACDCPNQPLIVVGLPTCFLTLSPQRLPLP